MLTPKYISILTNGGQGRYSFIIVAFSKPYDAPNDFRWYAKDVPPILYFKPYDDTYDVSLTPKEGFEAYTVDAKNEYGWVDSEIVKETGFKKNRIWAYKKKDPLPRREQEVVNLLQRVIDGASERESDGVVEIINDSSLMDDIKAKIQEINGD
jgi:hypothetical protein